VLRRERTADLLLHAADAAHSNALVIETVGALDVLPYKGNCDHYQGH